MCGIAGIFSGNQGRPPSGRELEAMIASVQHRGPDGSATFVDGAVGLAHARLSIIDLDGGWQPIHNEDRTIWVILNGEIFNYLELRRELTHRGHSFYTDSDTEVLVHLYEDFGDAFVNHLNGQFAIALWDARNQRIVLARDRVGIRPLFYTRLGQRLLFASEAKALFALPEVPRRLDPKSLASIFSYWSALPTATVFEGVMSLPPGHVLTVAVSSGNEPTISRYWDWSFPEPALCTTASEDDCADELRSLLIDAVRLQLRADVPVGAYLSGGLDSSIITSIIHHHTSTPLRTFSLMFEDQEFDERTFQRELVSYLHTDHSETLCTRASIGRSFPRTVWHAESPLIRTAPAPMMLLAQGVRASGYKVVLTGEGADEVFAGYDLFKEAKIRRFMARQPDSKWRGRILERLYSYLPASPGAGHALAHRFFGASPSDLSAPWFAHDTRMRTTRRAISFFQPEWRRAVSAWDPQDALVATLPADFMRWHPMGRDQYVEAHTLMSGYLLSSQGDRMAMAASIEARFPFLDHRVIEFANRLPPQFKLRGLMEKLILKRAMRAELPASIWRRTKQPYRAPDSSSFFEDARPLPWVADILSLQRLREVGIFDPTSVTRLLEKCRAGRAIGFGDNMAFVGVLSTMLVYEQFIKGNGQSAPSF
jgi:asparagine synthase (glutamine-hydrolysing)